MEDSTNTARIYHNNGGNATNLIINYYTPQAVNNSVNYNYRYQSYCNSNMNMNNNSSSTTESSINYPRNDYKQQNTQQQPQKFATKTRPERNVNFYLFKLFNEIINQKETISTLTAFKMLFEKLALKVTLKIFGIDLNEQIVSNIISNKWMKELINFVGFVRGVNGYVSAAESIDIYSRIASVTKEMNGYLLGYHRKYNISVLEAMNDICDESKCKVNGTVYVVHHLQEITKRLNNNYAIGSMFNHKQLLLFIDYAQKNGQINDVTEILRQIYFNGFTILCNAALNTPMDVVHSSFGRPEITISPYIGSYDYGIVRNLACVAKQRKRFEIRGSSSLKYATFVYKCDDNVTLEFAKNHLTVLKVECCGQRNGNNGNVKMNPNAATYQPFRNLVANAKK